MDIRIKCIVMVYALVLAAVVLAAIVAVASSASLAHIPPAPNSSGFALSFSAGWNLISVPLNSTLRASDLTGNSSLGVDMVSAYNNSTGVFTTYYSGASAWKNMLIEPDRGYFVHAAHPSSFMVKGVAVSAHYINIYKGWNMVGWNGFSCVKASDVLHRVSLSMVSRYNNSAGVYQSYYNGASPGNDFTLKRGEGYFLLSENASVQRLYNG